MIRLLLVDDHAAFREPLAHMLDREPDIEVVAQAGSVAEATTLLEGIDVAIVDLNMPDGDGLPLIRELRRRNPHGMVLVLSGTVDQTDLARAVEAGAAGVLQKYVHVDEIIEGVRRLGHGEPMLSRTQMLEMVRIASHAREASSEGRKALARLTAREREVLQALADGLSDKQIAERLHIQRQTARVHVTSILGKLDVDSRLQAVLFAIRHGAASVGPPVEAVTPGMSSATREPSRRESLVREPLVPEPLVPEPLAGEP